MSGLSNKLIFGLLLLFYSCKTNVTILDAMIEISIPDVRKNDIEKIDNIFGELVYSIGDSTYVVISTQGYYCMDIIYDFDLILNWKINERNIPENTVYFYMPSIYKEDITIENYIRVTKGIFSIDGKTSYRYEYNKNICNLGRMITIRLYKDFDTYDYRQVISMMDKYKKLSVKLLTKN